MVFDMLKRGVGLTSAARDTWTNWRPGGLTGIGEPMTATGSEAARSAPRRDDGPAKARYAVTGRPSGSAAAGPRPLDRAIDSVTASPPVLVRAAAICPPCHSTACLAMARPRP